MLENYNKDQHFGDRWGKCWSGSSAEFYIKRCYDFKEAYIEMLSGSIYKDQIIYHPLDGEIHRLKKHLKEKEEMIRDIIKASGYANIKYGYICPEPDFIIAGKDTHDIVGITLKKYQKRDGAGE